MFGGYGLRFAGGTQGEELQTQMRSPELSGQNRLNRWWFTAFTAMSAEPLVRLREAGVACLQFDEHALFRSLKSAEPNGDAYIAVTRRAELAQSTEPRCWRCCNFKQAQRSGRDV